jgi:hypothetical protein
MFLDRASATDGIRIIQGGGLQWSVREATCTTPDGRAGSCLIFENEAVVRRVRRFPADWRTRSDEALYALSLAF